MSDTLDGMTVEQLDNLIARATATKKKIEDEKWVALPLTAEGYHLRLDRRTLEVEYKSGIAGWTSLPLTSEVVQFAKGRLWRSSDLTNAANAILALAKKPTK